MKSCNALIFSLGLAAASAQAAFVTGQVSVAGYLTAIGASGVGLATGLDFVAGSTGVASPGLAGGLTGFGSGSGAFAVLSCTDAAGGCGTVKDIARFTTSAPIVTFMSLVSGTSTALSFDLTSLFFGAAQPGREWRQPDPDGHGCHSFHGVRGHTGHVHAVNTGRSGHPLFSNHPGRARAHALGFGLVRLPGTYRAALAAASGAAGTVVGCPTIRVRVSRRMPPPRTLPDVITC
jgi:hypothetical protein